MIDQVLERIVKSEQGELDDDATANEDDGLYYPIAYVLRTWEAYRQFGVLPEAGGINDQCPRWWDDVQTMNRRYVAAAARLRSDQETQKLIGNQDAPHWTEMLKHG